MLPWFEVRPETVRDVYWFRRVPVPLMGTGTKRGDDFLDMEGCFGECERGQWKALSWHRLSARRTRAPLPTFYIDSPRPPLRATSD